MKSNSLFTKLCAVGMVLLAMVGAGTSCLAQITNAPRTYFEAFDMTIDATLVKGMTTMGVLNSQISFPVEIRAECIRNLQTSNSVYGIAVRTSVAPHQNQTDYLDYDELAAFISAVDSIKQADRPVASMDNFDVVFQSRSGLSLTKSSRNGKIILYLKSGDPAAERNYLEPYVLETLKLYLSAAKSKLDLLR